MKILYIIGNGFDIHHKLDTRYQSFANYLAENNSEVYDLLLNYYGLPDITNPELTDEEYALWSRFEQALADPSLVWRGSSNQIVHYLRPEQDRA